jgi:hypothetical protein
VLDSDSPKFRALMDRILRANQALPGASIFGRAKAYATIGISMARLYSMRTQSNALPVGTRLVPAW